MKIGIDPSQYVIQLQFINPHLTQIYHMFYVLRRIWDEFSPWDFTQVTV